MTSAAELRGMLGGYLNNQAASDLVKSGMDTLTISRVSEEMVGFDKDAKEKPVVYFNEIKQAVVVNGSRADQLCSLFPDGKIEGNRVRLTVERLKGSEQIVFHGAD